MNIAAQFLSGRGPNAIDPSRSPFLSLLKGDLSGCQDSVKSLAGRVPPSWHRALASFFSRGFLGEILVFWGTIVLIV